MPVRYFTVALLLVLSAASACAVANPHPRLLLSPEDVELISSTSSLPAGFELAIQRAKKDADRFLSADIPDVPVPKDAGGGYTHEQHKRNSTTIQNAGFLYQVTSNYTFISVLEPHGEYNGSTAGSKLDWTGFYQLYEDSETHD